MLVSPVTVAVLLSPPPVVAWALVPVAVAVLLLPLSYGRFGAVPFGLRLVTNAA